METMSSARVKRSHTLISFFTGRILRGYAPKMKHGMAWHGMGGAAAAAAAK